VKNRVFIETSKEEKEMNSSRTRKLLGLGLLAGVLAIPAVKSEAAVTITSWTNIACNAGTMNGITAWDIPNYNNQIRIGSGAAGTNAALVISNSVHWTSNNTYILMGPIMVVEPAVVYIDPGTVIRGWPWTDPNVTLPGTLTITKGAKIIARGTVSHPIIFTDMWDNNVPGMKAGVVGLNGGTNATGYVDDFASPFVNSANPRNYSRWEPAFGYWGGVQIVGKTPVVIDNAQTNAVKTTLLGFTEGLPNSSYTQYGNGPLDDDDCSGVLTYCQIRYNGFPLAAAKEINGLSLYGVGRETEIHHIESMNAFDDGVEWFGGTVNTKYMVVWSCGDDSFDSDEGYRGKAQFLFSVQGAIADTVVKQGTGGGEGFVAVIGSGWGDKGMEVDGTGANEMGVPMGLSQWYNLTIIGKGPTNGMTALNNNWSARSSDQVEANTAILCRDNAGPQIRNSVFADFRGAGIVIEAREDKVLSGYSYDCLTRAKTDWNVVPANTNTVLDNSIIYTAQDSGKQLEVKNCVFYNLGPAGIAPLTTNAILRAGGYEQAGTASLHIDGEGNATKYPHASIDVDMAGAAYSNVLASATPVGHIARCMDPSSDLTAKNVYAVTNINPCAANDAATGAPLPPANGFYSPVTYKGAFAPDNNWMAGWTCADSLGLIDTSMNQYGVDLGGGTNSAPTISVIGSYPSIKFGSEAGANYQIQGTTNLVSGPWTTLGTVAGNGGDVWFADQSGKPVNFMRVIHQ
jgi:hypothetical protein